MTVVSGPGGPMSALPPTAAVAADIEIGREGQILLQKSATVMAGLPECWRTSCGFCSLGSGALGKFSNRLDCGYALVRPDEHRLRAVIGQSALRACEDFARSPRA
jgi:hypothetical protein